MAVARIYSGKKTAFGGDRPSEGLDETRMVKVYSGTDLGMVQVGILLVREEGDDTKGQFIDLDRDRCNRLIRELRAARDRTFGKDE